MQPSVCGAQAEVHGSEPEETSRASPLGRTALGHAGAGGTAGRPAVQTGPAVRREGANRCARVQGNMLGHRTRNGAVRSQTAVAFGKTLFPDGC